MACKTEEKNQTEGEQVVRWSLCPDPLSSRRVAAVIRTADEAGRIDATERVPRVARSAAASSENTLCLCKIIHEGALLLEKLLSAQFTVCTIGFVVRRETLRGCVEGVCW